MRLNKSMSIYEAWSDTFDPDYLAAAEALKLKKARQIGTHDGKRVPNRGKCEKCGTETNWTVIVAGLRHAYWCGCGN